MKRLLTVSIWLMLFVCVVCPLPGQNNAAGMKSFVKNDTTFLRREYLGECGWHKIYIEKNRRSVYYKRLKDFRFGENDTNAYNFYMSGLRKNIPGGLKAFDLDSLPNHWLPLHLYEGKYYLYAPSDWGTAGKMIIDEFSIISWYMDGPMPVAIKNLEKEENRYTFTYFSGSVSDEPSYATLIVYIIDPAYKIAVWEYRSDEGKSSYALYLPAKYADYFQVISNAAEGCKMTEVDFDKPDYKTLISNTIK